MSEDTEPLPPKPRWASGIMHSVVWFALTALTLWGLVGLDPVTSVMYAWVPMVGVLVGVGTIQLCAVLVRILLLRYGNAER